MNEEQMEEQVNDTDTVIDAASEEPTTPDAASEADAEAAAEKRG